MPKYKVKVTALPEKGFRRAGIQFTREPSEVTVDADQLEILRKEPLVVVQVLEEIPDEDKGGGSGQLNAKATIEKINAVQTIEELDALLQGEERSSVLQAAEKIRQKFQAPA